MSNFLTIFLMNILSVFWQPNETVIYHQDVNQSFNFKPSYSHCKKYDTSFERGVLQDNFFEQYFYEVEKKADLLDQVSVSLFGAKGDGLTDDSAAIQRCIDYCIKNGKNIYIPKTDKSYLLGCNQLFGDESTFMAPTVRVALEMKSGMNIISNGATLKIKNNISSKNNPVPMRMFFSNNFLENLSFNGLILDMNGENNLISPNLPSSPNNFTQAHILFSGTKGMTAAGANNVVIEHCEFLNTAGVTCIGMAQSNKPNVNIGSNWIIRNNKFFNNGFDSSDHSSIYGWANDVNCYNNTFNNPLMFDNKTKTGGLVAYEIHGSNHKFYSNIIDNYYQGLWVGINLSQPLIEKTEIYNNKASVSMAFADFYNGNLETSPFYPINIVGVNIFNNYVTITDNDVDDATKQFIRIASKIHPENITINNNIAIGKSNLKNTAFATVVILANQEKALKNLTIKDNNAKGLGDGIIFFWGKEMILSNVKIFNNNFNTFIKLKDAHNVDVLGYGPSTGKVVDMQINGQKKIQTDNSKRFY